jgi:succinoglycan biosynthesis transport protein ExoP
MRGRFKKTATPMPVEPESGEVSLGSIGRALWRRKQSIIGPTLIIAAAAFIAVNLMAPKFKSEARVLVEGRENIFLRPEAEKAMMDRGVVDQETLTSQVQLILSRDLARQVVAKLKLEELPEFNAALNGFSPFNVLRYIGLAKDPMSMSLEERVLAAYYEKLGSYTVDKSRVIVIEFQSADPELAARAANVIAETYLTMQQVAKQDQARSAGQWLSGELEKLRLKVSEAEAKVETFRAKSNLFIGANNSSLAAQQLTELSTQLSTARAQKADAETRARAIREQLKSGQPLESADVSNSELIRRLSEQRVTLRAQLAEQSSTLLPQHPRIKELRAQIADLDQQIRSEGERLVRSLENDAKLSGSRVEMLSGNLDQLKRQQASTSGEDVQLRALEREAKAQRDLFESYLAKYREASARDSIAAAPADARVISRAVVSNLPYSPKKLPIVLVSALAAFCVSSAFVAAGALLRAPSYRPVLEVDTSPAEPERSPNARTRLSDRVPAPVPPTAAAATPAVADSKPAPLALDDIVAGLRQAGEGGRRVAVIGAAREVGTTLTAIALARSLARHARVVLVDLAFNSPNVDVISNNPSAPGMAELVRGAASFGDVITRDRFSRLHLVAVGQLDGSADFAGSHMMAAALDALAQSYDHLVVDAGAQPEADIAALARFAPRAVLVAGEAADDVQRRLSAQLREAGFADVAVLAGAPPDIEHAATETAAA